MNVLLIGGAGHVGTMTLPYMKSHHNFRVLDLNPPKDDIYRIYPRLRYRSRHRSRRRWRGWTRSSIW